MIPDILTERLRLVAITPPLMQMESATLGGLLHAEVPSAWPPEHWEPHVFDFMLQQQIRSPWAAGWNRYVLLRSPTPVVIGTVGGFPRTETEAEIGYSILGAWQRRGLATEGIRALMREILSLERIQTLTAQTFPSLPASLRVLEKCGFCFAGPGDEAGSVRYRIDRRDCPL